MKKFSVSCLIVLLLMSVSYGAESENASDYVRRDIFDAKMDALSAKIDALFTKMDARIDALEKVMNTRFEEINKRVEAIDKRFDVMDKRIDYTTINLGARIDDLKTAVYWIFSVLTLILTLITFSPAISEVIKSFRKPAVPPTPAITLDDVKRLMVEAMSAQK